MQIEPFKRQVNQLGRRAFANGVHVFSINRMVMQRCASMVKAAGNDNSIAVAAIQLGGDCATWDDPRRGVAGVV